MQTNSQLLAHDAKRFLHRRVTFDYKGKRLSGIVIAQRYTGPTERGQIPDYELQVQGSSGAVLTISLVESYATFP